MARAWTDEQRTAFETRDRTLLVSAAAGSGKTAVLIERVIRSLTEGEPPMDISRILAVTFTHAAATELKERVAAALSKAIETAEDTTHLARQLRLLPTAKISTIHSFCLDLLHKYANQLGLRPNVRVADDSEGEPLALDLMTEVLNDAYAGLVSGVATEDLRAFIEDLNYTRKVNKLIDALLEIHKSVSTTKEGVSTLRACAETYLTESQGDVMDTRWGLLLKEQLAPLTRDFVEKLDALWQGELSGEPASLAKLGEHYDYYSSFAMGLLSRLDSYATLREHILSFAPKDFPRASKAFPKTEGVSRMQNLLKDFAKHFKNVKEENYRTLYFFLTLEEWQETLRHAHMQVHIISCLLEEFDRRFRQEMGRRGAVNFNLMERYAYELLWQDGKPTPICEEVRSLFDAVYVDEYQDVSPLQHALFEAVGTDHRFMVGDIKQSIYSFRHAEPEIFASLKRNLPPLDRESPQKEAGIFMSKNFRCDRTVVDFVNKIFDFLFAHTGESIHYVPEDRLTYAKVGEDPTLSAPVVCAFFNPSPKANPTPEELLEEPDDGGVEEDELLGEEPLWVAQEIKRLLDSGVTHDGKTPIAPKDIVILLRSTKEAKVLPFITALSALGIPVACTDKSDFFLNPEVQLALCILNVIDNPRRDIYLTGCLCSPLYGFTPDELMHIRREAPRTACLYEALESYCLSHPEFDKGCLFLKNLASLREVAEGIPVWRLLDRIYHETPLMAIAGKEQAGAENNLKLLYNYARTCAGVSISGLYGFIHFINKQIATGRKFNSPASSAEPNAVEILSMHHSKGLERPVVFVSRLGGGFNENDKKSDLIVDNEFGLVLKRKHPRGHIRVDTPMRKLVSNHISCQQVEEEMRLLYVALTRAQNRLYLTGTVPGCRTKNTTPFEYAVKNAQAIAEHPTREAILASRNMLSLVFPALCASGEVPAPTVYIEESSKQSLANRNLYGDSLTDASSQEDKDLIAWYSELLKTRFGYSYPYEYLSHIPKKVAVSRLSPSMLDEREEQDALEGAPFDLAVFLEESKQEFTTNVLRLPKLLSGKEEEIKASDRGIATHLFMQFCNFHRLKQEGPEAEVAHLLREGFLDEKTVSLIRMEELTSFWKSALLDKLLEAKKIYREFRFHLRFPAGEFTANPTLKERLEGETLYVQGVIDAVICLEDGILLVDYKTDRLSRAELADRSLAEKKLRARHSGQLAYYKAAIQRIFKVAPREILLYSLPLGDTIPL